MKALVEFFPLAAPLFVIVWVTKVHRRCLNELRQAYMNAGLSFSPPPVKSLASLNAWRVFEPRSEDTPAIVGEKERLRREAKRQLRYSGIIFFVAFFGLAILSIFLSQFFN